jgi:plastocyanin/mono/diheme cytochrome c family protein
MPELRPATPENVEGLHPATLGSVEGRSELMALVALSLILIVLPATVFVYQFVFRPALAEVRTIDITVAAPEAGGFQPDSFRVAAGETVRLRFSVPDVTHGLAIGPGLGLDWGHLDPGEVKEVEVTFDQPGRYTLYCNIWCSPNHWWMRGTIEVYDPANPAALQASHSYDPVLEALAARNVDIDTAHEAPTVPAEQPSVTRGAMVVERWGDRLPVELTNADWRRSHSPAEAWALLVKDGLSEAEAWDAVAYLWLANADAPRLQAATSLYAKNCATCHGEAGDGRGPGADALAVQGLGSDMNMTKEPTAFAEPGLMLGGSSDIYYAKLRRGGMGTGMPSYGPIFTPDETWMLVDYLWTFVFEVDAKNESIMR